MPGRDGNEAASTPRGALWPLQAAVALVFATIVLAISAGLVWYNYGQLKDLAEREASADFKAIADSIRGEVANSIRIAETLIDTATQTIDPDLPPERLNPMLVSLMREVDEILPATFGLFVGRPDGTLVEAQDLTGPRPRELRGFGKDATIGLLIIERGPAGATERWVVLDRTGQEIGRVPPRPTDFDSRTRPWYGPSLSASRPIVTKPYLFANVPGAGITIAREMRARPGTVFGLDITLSDLDAFLARSRRPPVLEPVIFDRAGGLVAHPEGERFRSGSEGPLPVVGDLASPIVAALSRAFGRAGFEKETRFRVGTEEYFARFEPAGTVLGEYVIGIAVPYRAMLGEAERIRNGLLLVGAAAIIVALLFVSFAARLLVAPLRTATSDLTQIARLEFGTGRPVRSRLAEVDALGRAIGTLELALQNFVRYVPFALVQGIVDRGLSPRLGGKRQPICVLFSDIAGFTTLAETLAPEELTRRTSAYFSAAGAELVRSGATIDKYIGDSIMAFWNAPEMQEDYVRLACLGALRSSRRIDALNRDAAARGEAPMPTRFGLHAGEAVVGNIGSVDRMNYTVLGHVVNLASRIEGANKAFGTTILVSDEVRARAGQGFVFRPVGERVMRGAIRPVALFELLGADVPGEPDLAASTAETTESGRPGGAATS